MSTGIQKQIENKALTLFDRAKNIQVVDDATCQQAEEGFKAIKLLDKKWSSLWDEKCSQANKLWKSLVKERDRFSLKTSGDNQAKIAFYTLSTKASKYRQEQKRIRLEAAEKIHQEQVKQEEDARLAAAEAAEKSDDKELAEAIVMQPVYVPQAKPIEVPKTSGVSYTERWKPEVINLKALVDAVASGRAPLQALQPNESFLRQQARAMKTENLYPGVRAFAEKTPNIII